MKVVLLQSINTNEEAIELIVNSIEKSNLKPGKDVVNLLRCCC